MNRLSSWTSMSPAQLSVDDRLRRGDSVLIPKLLQPCFVTPVDDHHAVTSEPDDQPDLHLESSVAAGSYPPERVTVRANDSTDCQVLLDRDSVELFEELQCSLELYPSLYVVKVGALTPGGGLDPVEPVDELLAPRGPHYASIRRAE